jgi:hypothetical protein
MAATEHKALSIEALNACSASWFKFDTSRGSVVTKAAFAREALSSKDQSGVTFSGTAKTKPSG